ncbi:transporter substrate-binding domain-containing protein [Halobacteriovorax sp. GB3]|uniref:substrate-binding periplasmic protein n=1 Tax=Halobacteriovorax sp. GB3 TaxID=2719615 RepID=UPI00235E834D|nr:transporter substrate-binding domain-containing protein [Halobacteriovorax sp. GB3]MDD0851543.1 transporter substrate-binding domain-containing protein [Halobacteriovorax sp. GB3]
MKRLSSIISLFFLMNSYASENIVRLVSLDWEPYVGRSLPDQGFVTKLIKDVYQFNGKDVSISFRPWARALKEARSGDFDGLYPEYLNKDLRKEFIYSDSFMVSPVGFYKLEGSDVFPGKSYESIKAYRIGLVHGYINHPIVDEHKDLRVEYAVDDLQNLSKLCRGRLDLVFIDFKVAKHLLKKNSKQLCSNIIEAAPALEKKKLYIVFSKKVKGHKERRDEFNRFLENYKKKKNRNELVRK